MTNLYRTLSIFSLLLLVLPKGYTQNTEDVMPITFTKYSIRNTIKKINDPSTRRLFQDYKRGVARVCYSEGGDFKCVNGFLINTTDNLHKRNEDTQVINLYLLTKAISQDEEVTCYLSFDFELPGMDGVEVSDGININTMYEYRLSRLANHEDYNLYRINLEGIERGDNLIDIIKKNKGFYNAYVFGWDLGFNSIRSKQLTNISHIGNIVGSNKKNSYKSIFQDFPGSLLNNSNEYYNGMLIPDKDFNNFQGSNFDNYSITTSPLINSDGSVIAYAQGFNQRYNLLKSNWLSYRENREYKEYYINALDRRSPSDNQETWINKVNGGYLLDLDKNPSGSGNLFNLNLSNDTKSTPIVMSSLDFFPFKFDINKRKIKYDLIHDYYGDGIKPSGLSPKNTDVMLYLTPDADPNILLYGRRYDNSVGNTLNKKVFKGKKILVSQNPYSLTNFPTFNYSMQHASYKGKLGSPKYLKQNLLDYISYQNNVAADIQNLSDFNFPATLHLLKKPGSGSASIRGIKLPYTLPINASEIFNQEAYTNYWKSYKYEPSKYSTKINQAFLYIESVEIKTWTHSEESRNAINENPQDILYPITPVYSKKITTGDNGGYVNLDNLAYKLETNTSLQIMNDFGLPDDLVSQDHYLEIIISLKKNFNDIVSARAWVDYFNREEPLNGKNETNYTYNFVNDPVAHPIEKIGESSNLYNIEDFNVIRINSKIPKFGIDENTSKIGKKRLRIAVKRGSTFPEPNSVNEAILGEVEDYLLDVKLASDDDVNSDLIQLATIQANSEINIQGAQIDQQDIEDTATSCSTSGNEDHLPYDQTGEESNLGIDRVCNEWSGPCVVEGNCYGLYNFDISAVGQQVLNLDGQNYVEVDTEGLYTTGDLSKGFSLYLKFSPNNVLNSSNTKSQYLLAMGNAEGTQTGDGWSIRFKRDNPNPFLEFTFYNSAAGEFEYFDIHIDKHWFVPDQNIWMGCLLVKIDDKFRVNLLNLSTGGLYRETFYFDNKGMNINEPTFLGGFNSSDYDKYSGKIDQFLFWDSPLSDDNQDILLDIENTSLSCQPNNYLAYAEDVLPYCGTGNYQETKTNLARSYQENFLGSLTFEVEKTTIRYANAKAIKSYYIDPLFDLPQIPYISNEVVFADPSQEGYNMNLHAISSALQEENPNELTNQNLMMDIYYPKPKPGKTFEDIAALPVIIYHFGGAFVWNTRQSKLTEETCKWLAGKGYVVAAIDYRVGLYPYDAELGQRAMIRAWQDSRTAVKWWQSVQNHEKLENNKPVWKIDPTKIFALGHSAGGITAQTNIYLDEAKFNEEIAYDDQDNALGFLKAITDDYSWNVTDLDEEAVEHRTYDLTDYEPIPCLNISTGTDTYNLCDILSTASDNTYRTYTGGNASLNTTITSLLNNFDNNLSGRVNKAASFAGAIAKQEWMFGTNKPPSTDIHHEEDKTVPFYTDFPIIGYFGDIINLTGMSVSTISGGGAMKQEWDTRADDQKGVFKLLSLSGLNQGGTGNDEPKFHVPQYEFGKKYKTHLNDPEGTAFIEPKIMYYVDAFFMKYWGNATPKSATNAGIGSNTNLVTEPIDQPDFSLYPNPAKDKINILVEVRQQGPLQIDIYDMNGRQVYSINRPNITQGHQLITLPVEKLGAGNYILSLKAGDVVRSEKVIVK